MLLLFDYYLDVFCDELHCKMLRYEVELHGKNIIINKQLKFQIGCRFYVSIIQAPKSAKKESFVIVDDGEKL